MLARMGRTGDLKTLRPVACAEHRRACVGDSRRQPDIGPTVPTLVDHHREQPAGGVRARACRGHEPAGPAAATARPPFTSTDSVAGSTRAPVDRTASGQEWSRRGPVADPGSRGPVGRGVQEQTDKLRRPGSRGPVGPTTMGWPRPAGGERPTSHPAGQGLAAGRGCPPDGSAAAGSLLLLRPGSSHWSGSGQPMPVLPSD